MNEGGGMESRAHTRPCESCRRILVAASDLSLSQSLENALLEDAHCAFVSAASREEIVNKLQSRSFDVLLLETTQAAPDLELIAAIEAGAPEVDVLVLAAITPDFPYLATMNSGVRDIIGTPVIREELRARLLRVFRERETRRELILAEQKYHGIFEFNVDGMALIVPETNRIVDANHAFSALSGYSRPALYEKAVTDLLTANEHDRFVYGLSLCAKSGQGTLGDITLVDSGGQNLLIDISVTFLSLGAEELVLLAFKDVTEKRVLEQHLADAALKDDLTGLWNKKTFQLNLQHAVSQSRESQEPLSLIFIDVDNFKKCNDTHGHPAGDRILQLVGECINRNIRHRSDEGFRCGGDEFAVILTESDLEAARAIGERIRQDFMKLETAGTTLSAGIVQYKSHMPAAAFSKAADEALYRAKALGKNAQSVG